MTPAEVEQEIQRRIRLPYHRVISGEPVEGFLAEIPELPGCITAGATAAEALANLEEALEGWLEAALKNSLPIPEPSAGMVSISA